MAGDIILTQEGKQQLEEELLYLENEKRAEVGERIKVAREFGDISENSEYDDAKNEQAVVEARIAEINQILAEATVATTSKRSTKVNVGSTVHVLVNGKKKEYTIVGTAEANAAEGKISNESPIGAALLGGKKGEEMVAVGPTGKEISLKIEKISQ
ncbi:MAG: transcription elongation factor GreA [Eggerthellaceae bacterium]|nr:transcription elongation factor GreA [Eggerthellaceae bacterium]